MPRLGPDVPQWFGESIGFWDGEALISWTSNIQGWIIAWRQRIQQQAAVDRNLHAAQGCSGELIGIRHETVLYDPEAYVDPVRIVQTWERLGRLNENEPFTAMECVPHIFPVHGTATPQTPGATFEYSLPDMYGRPWAQIWERYHEQGMERPGEEDLFSFPPAAEK